MVRKCVLNSLTVPNAIEFSRVSLDQIAKRGGGRRVEGMSCDAKTVHNRPSPRGILLHARRETRTSRIPFTLGNPYGYQLPEIPHTYPVKPSRYRPLYIWGRLPQFAVTHTSIFTNFEHPILISTPLAVRIYFSLMFKLRGKYLAYNQIQSIKTIKLLFI